MTELGRIHEDLIEMYERVYEHAGRAARNDPSLLRKDLPALIRARNNIQDQRTGTMDVRDRAWHRGRLDTICLMIGERRQAQPTEETS